MNDRQTLVLLFSGLLVAVGVAWLVGFGGFVGATAPNCSTVTYDGEGTEVNPYEVGNVDQLQCIRKQGLDANYAQVSDIDASTTRSWKSGKGFDPIGNSSTRDIMFNGTFDGNGYNITDLTIRRGALSYDSGMFGQVGSAGMVTNVSVVDADISGHIAVGSIVGYNDGGTIDNSYASGSVEADFVVGGLVGLNREGTVDGSYSSVSVDGSQDVGGFVGSNEGTIKNSYATGGVDGNKTVGGFVGHNDGTVGKSYWDMNATGQKASDGGIGLTTAEMTGEAALGNMTEFDFTNTWKTVPSDYPALRR